MKRYLFSFVLLLLSIFFCSPLRSNPIALMPPEFYASELMFDSDGKWIIELHSYTFDIPEVVDSVRITTSSGSAKWNKPDFGNQEEGYWEHPDVFILQNDSLDSDLTIHSEGDFVQVTTYYEEGAWWGTEGKSSSHTFIFGNYTGALVRSPKEGESIAHVPYLMTLLNDYTSFYYNKFIYSKQYAIDPTPGIGQLNDENVAGGKLSARIHNLSDQPFSESRLSLKDEHYYSVIDLALQTDGLYSGDVYACKYYFDKLYPWEWPATVGWNSGHDYWTINPVEFEIEQDTILTLDIYINRYVDIQTVKPEETVLRIISNPITENAFTYETTLPVKSSKSIIEIIGLNGQIIAQYPVSENKGKITLPSNIAKGIYHAALTVNRKRYATAKIIVR
ncbi:MAG: T9SS type A sorting domain-containing protein [Dysgonamonadaceae bacterium]|jgi:hypothetical protein|nr:T9SS type A sorting domain-containing protein [Dysgonamonadaceae bacterium]